MKNIFIASLVLIMLIGCSTEELEISEENQSTPLENLVKDVSDTSVSDKSTRGSKNNPIVINSGIGIVNSSTDLTGIVEFGKYYNIYGEVVRLTTPPSVLGGHSPKFFYKDIPNSSQIRMVTFKADGSGVERIGAPTNHPFESFDCNKIEANNGRLNGKEYSVKDNGAVYELVDINYFTTILDFAGECKSANVPDRDTITCEGVAEWKRGRRYKIGDRVLYLYRLFERVEGGWIQLKQCF